MQYLLLPILVHIIIYDLTIEGELGVRIFFKVFSTVYSTDDLRHLFRSEKKKNLVENFNCIYFFNLLSIHANSLHAATAVIVPKQKCFNLCLICANFFRQCFNSSPLSLKV